jgi:hypothetical protein
MGCDAKLIQRGSLNIFKANIGVATKTDDPNRFNRFYDNYMENIFKAELKAKMDKGV